MENFPENENLNEQEEFSTVFSNPTEHTTKAVKNGNKKRILTVLSAFCALAVLVGGTFAAVKLIPKKSDETTGQPELKEIEVLSQKDTDLKSVTVNNKNGSFKFYSIITKAEDENSEDTAKWYLEGYKQELVSTSSISNIVNNITNISASREITEKTAEECGLVNPAISADVAANDGGKWSVLIGSKSPDNSGVYLKLSTKDTIYLIPDAIDESLTFEPLDLANTDSIAGINLDSNYADYTEDGKLKSFDSIIVSGKNFPKNVVIKPNNNDIEKTISYVITEPVERVAENADKLLSVFSDGITVSGAYSFDVTPETLSALGLNNPDFAAKIKVKDFTYTYKFKLQSDGSYAVVTDDSIMVKKVSAGSLEVLGYTETDFYADWVFIESIDKIANLTVNSGGKSYSFDIKANEDEESEESYIVNYDGKTLKSYDFQSFYQYCISLKSSDFTTENLSGPDDASLVYSYNDGTKPVTVTFKKATATKYQYYINGSPMGKVNSSEFNKLDKYLKQLVSGQTVTYN